MFRGIEGASQDAEAMSRSVGPMLRDIERKHRGDAASLRSTASAPFFRSAPAVSPHLRPAERIAQVGYDGMMGRKLIKAQDQIEGGCKVCELVAEVGVHTAMQQRW